MKNKFIVKEIDNFEGITTFNLNYQCQLDYIGSVELRRLKTKDTDTLFLCIYWYSSEYDNLSPGFLYLEKKSFIIRINNSENIQLGRPTIDRKDGQKSLYDYHYDIYKFYKWYEESYKYEITPEQLQKICEADMVAIKVNNRVYDDKSFQHLFLEYCQIFYNGTYDSTLYIDTVKKQEKQREQEEKEKKEKEEQEALLAQKKERINDILKWLFIIFILFLLFIFYNI
jgi:hypothetical protein